MTLKPLATGAVALLLASCSGLDLEQFKNLPPLENQTQNTSDEAVADETTVNYDSTVEDNYFMLEDDAEVEAEESVAEPNTLRSEIRGLKHSLRQSIRSEVLQCAGIDATLFEDFRALKAKLRADRSSVEDAVVQLATSRLEIVTAISENKEQLIECKVQIKTDDDPRIVALNELGASCGGKIGKGHKKGQFGKRGRFSKVGMELHANDDGSKKGRRGKKNHGMKQGEDRDDRKAQRMAMLSSEECIAAIEKGKLVDLESTSVAEEPVDDSEVSVEDATPEEGEEEVTEVPESDLIDEGGDDTTEV